LDKGILAGEWQAVVPASGVDGADFKKEKGFLKKDFFLKHQKKQTSVD